MLSQSTVTAVAGEALRSLTTGRIGPAMAWCASRRSAPST